MHRQVNLRAGDAIHPVLRIKGTGTETKIVHCWDYLEKREKTDTSIWGGGGGGGGGYQYI